MHFEERSFERAAALALGVVAITSCASVTRFSNEGTPSDPERDGGAGDAAPSTPDSATPSIGRDAGTRRQVKCAGTPCAVDLASPASRSGTFCALLESGRVVCWGENALGELGRGEDAGTVPSGRPAFVEGVSDATMLDGSCAVLADGRVVCWGAGTFLQDGGTLPTVTPVTLPIPPAKRVRTTTDAEGNEAGCALLMTGETTCWGLGLFSVQVDGTLGWVGTAEPTVVALPAGPPVVELAVAEARFVLRADGALLSWGAWRSLGRASSLPIDPYPMPVALSGVSDVDAVGGRVCAAAGGNVYCWGEPHLAETTVPASALPELVFGLPSDMVQVSTTMRDGSVSYQRACAVAAGGDVYCWGANDVGQAGDGTRTFALPPVKVLGLPEPAVVVRAASSATCALLESGRVHCWGSDTSGSLGRGTLGSFDGHPAPVVMP